MGSFFQNNPLKYQKILLHLQTIFFLVNLITKSNNNEEDFITWR